MSKDVIEGAIGFFVGFIVATIILVVLIESSSEIKNQAINLGYAKMVLEKPTDRHAKFEWIKIEDLIIKEQK